MGEQRDAVGLSHNFQGAHDKSYAVFDSSYCPPNSTFPGPAEHEALGSTEYCQANHHSQVTMMCPMWDHYMRPQYASTIGDIVGIARLP